MKLSIVTVLAVAALAGSAFAQSDHGTSGGATGPDPSRIEAPRPLAGATLREQKASADQMHLACASDAQSLCRRTNVGAATQCMIYHKLELSRPCRVALEKARQGRL